jgi:hypothetical protein
MIGRRNSNGNHIWLQESAKGSFAKATRSDEKVNGNQVLFPPWACPQENRPSCPNSDRAAWLSPNEAATILRERVGTPAGLLLLCSTLLRGGNAINLRTRIPLGPTTIVSGAWCARNAQEREIYYFCDLSRRTFVLPRAAIRPLKSPPYAAHPTNSEVLAPCRSTGRNCPSPVRLAPASNTGLCGFA